MTVAISTAKIRLSQEEKVRLTGLFNTHLAKYPDAMVYLFGSRVDPAERGGDIDLLIVSRGIGRNAYEVRKELSIAIKEQIGDQRVDILIYSGDCPDEQPAFIRLAQREGIQLWP